MAMSIFSALSRFLLLLSVAALAASAFADGKKVTHLHFYFYEYYDGPNQTSFVVASLNNTSGFGTVRVYDNALREGPGANARIVGRQQGLAAIASLEGQAFLTTQNFVFTVGRYNGSSLAVIGRANGADGITERAIVGGSGRFRMARGYAITKLLDACPSYIHTENDFYVTLDTNTN